MEQIQRKKRQAGTLGKYFYVFILPAFVVYLLFSIVPFLYTFYYSFTDYTDMNPVNLSFVGLKNYIKVFNTPLMITAIKNSVLYAITVSYTHLFSGNQGKRGIRHGGLRISGTYDEGEGGKRRP